MAKRRTSGSVRQRPSGRWQARIRNSTTGRVVGLGTFATKADADRALAVALADQTRGGWVDPARGRVLLTEYARRWLAERPQLRPRTAELYESLLRLHIQPALGQLELGRLQPSVIRRWHAQLLGAPRPGASTVAKSYRLLHVILATAVADELIARNPCVVEGAGVERAPERPVITVNQVWKLADTIEVRYRPMILMAGFMGLRRGELLGLRRGCIDLLHRRVAVVEQCQQLVDGSVIFGAPKTEAGRRTVAIPAPVLSELETHLEQFVPAGREHLVFTGVKGGPLRNHVWQTKWAKARDAVGLQDLHFHDLRHVANTLTAASGASTRELMHRMGHASPAAALRYQHATADRDAAIAEALAELIVPPAATVTPLRRDAKS